MSHLATANVGRQTVGDGSLQSPGETLLPRFLWVATLLMFTRSGQPCATRDNSRQVYIPTEDSTHWSTLLQAEGKRSYMNFPAEVISWNERLLALHAHTYEPVGLTYWFFKPLTMKKVIWVTTATDTANMPQRYDPHKNYNGSNLWYTSVRCAFFFFNRELHIHRRHHQVAIFSPCGLNGGWWQTARITERIHHDGF